MGQPIKEKLEKEWASLDKQITIQRDEIADIKAALNCAIDQKNALIRLQRKIAEKLARLDQ